jgi:hypothetical protein
MRKTATPATISARTKPAIAMINPEVTAASIRVSSIIKTSAFGYPSPSGLGRKKRFCIMDISVH